MKPNLKYKVDVPSGTTLEGPRRDKGTLWVRPGGKPPKLRFKPGTFLTWKGQRYEIMYAYRVEDNPHEWRYSLEERDKDSRPEAINVVLKILGAGMTTPRVVYEMFRNSHEAYRYFSDITMGGNRCDVSNGTLVREAEVEK